MNKNLTKYKKRSIIHIEGVIAFFRLKNWEKLLRAKKSSSSKLNRNTNALLGKGDSEMRKTTMQLLIAIVALFVSMSAHTMVIKAIDIPGNLSATILPETGEASTPSFNVYMAANLGDVWFVRSGLNWQEYKGGVIPVAGTFNLWQGAANIFVTDLDLSGLPGIKVYVGYGLSEADLGLPGHLSIVKTLEHEPTATCTNTTLINGVITCTWDMGGKIVGLNSIPSNCYSYNDQCWRDILNNGTVKTVATEMSLTGFSTRPLMFAVYRDWAGSYCARPIYKDDGTGVIHNQTAGDCFTDEFDWVVGTKTGIIFHFPQTGLCRQYVYNQATVSIDNIPANCPF